MWGTTKTNITAVEVTTQEEVRRAKTNQSDQEKEQVKKITEH